uniref:Uncharacterized protein n=1 Tax=Knipowitschia caucasica TaxID=637954 RepID=A0AAV2LAW2_KNICA
MPAVLLFLPLSQDPISCEVRGVRAGGCSHGPCWDTGAGWQLYGTGGRMSAPWGSEWFYAPAASHLGSWASSNHQARTSDGKLSRDEWGGNGILHDNGAVQRSPLSPGLATRAVATGAPGSLGLSAPPRPGLDQYMVL